MAGRHRKPPSRHHRGRHRQPPSNARWIAPTLATLAVLAAGGLSAYTALNGGDSGTPAAGAPTTAAPVATSTATATAPASASPTPASTPTAVDHPTRGHVEPAAVRLVVTGHVSWVEVTRANGHVAFSGLLRHGHRLVYPTGPVRIVVGDAGAVRLDRHGHRHAPLGRPGQVVRLTVH